MPKTIPKKKKFKKAKWFSEKALQIAEKTREAKGKGEWERYTQLNAEFQKTATRDKKTVLSEQCKEIEGNNRMGKTRGLFKNIGDTGVTFHVEMGTIKERNGKDLTESESGSVPSDCDSMGFSLPGSSIHGIPQAITLEWVAVPSPGDLPNPWIESRSPTLHEDC